MRSSSLSDEQLCTYVDNQLAAKERADVLAALKEDTELARQLNELQELKEWVRLAYQNPPQPVTVERNATPTSARQWRAAAASVVLLLVGGLTGWWLHTPTGDNLGPRFHELAQAPSVAQSNGKVLIHISDMDPARITHALDEAETLLRDSRQHHHPLQLEVVANAAGLGLLRAGSPFRRRIQSLASQYDNVAFLACGIAMENARLKEGHDVKLLPEAQPIDAALEQILRRLKAGWAYIRG